MTRTATSIWSARLLSLILALAFTALASHAQQPAPPTRQPSISADGAGLEANPRDPEQAHMMREMSKDRNNLRQKEIVDDTNQLSDLVKQLKDAVDKSSKDQLSLSVVNTAAEIEKLAKSIKEKMRDGQ